MTIRLVCGCGKRLRGTEAQAGRRATCPRCGTAVTIPTGPDAPEPSRRDPTNAVVLGTLVLVAAGVQIAIGVAEGRIAFHGPVVALFGLVVVSGHSFAAAATDRAPCVE